LSPKRTVFEVFDSSNAVTLKTRLWVTQCHRKWYHSIRPPWLNSY